VLDRRGDVITTSEWAAGLTDPAALKPEA
jgi:hypothetical protein